MIHKVADKDKNGAKNRVNSLVVDIYMINIRLMYEISVNTCCQCVIGLNALMSVSINTPNSVEQHNGNYQVDQQQDNGRVQVTQYSQNNLKKKVFASSFEALSTEVPRKLLTLPGSSTSEPVNKGAPSGTLADESQVYDKVILPLNKFIFPIILFPGRGGNSNCPSRQMFSGSRLVF